MSEHDSVTGGSHSVEESHSSNSALDGSQALARVFGSVQPGEALHTPRTRLEAPTKRPTSPHESYTGKTCHISTVESNISYERPEAPGYLQHDSMPSADDDDDRIENENNEPENKDNESEDEDDGIDDEDDVIEDDNGCPLVHLLERLHKLREVDALLQLEHMDE